MQTILLIVLVMSAFGVVALVLVQQGKGADAGAAFGSGASATVFGAQGSGSFMTRATGILAAIFFISCLGLAYLSSQRISIKSVTDVVAPAGDVAKPVAEDIPAVPDSAPLGSDVPNTEQ